MKCYEETSKIIESYVDEAIKTKGVHYAIGSLIGYLSYVLSYDLSDERYQLNINAINNHSKSLTLNQNSATVSNQ